METTITVEFISETEQHLKTLEHQLKHIHDVEVNLLEPRDHSAPALISVGIAKAGPRAERAAQEVALVLHRFLHDQSSPQGQKTIFLVTIEGERIDIESLSAEEIEKILVAAYQGTSA